MSAEQDVHIQKLQEADKWWADILNRDADVARAEHYRATHEIDYRNVASEAADYALVARTLIGLCPKDPIVDLFAGESPHGIALAQFGQKNIMTTDLSRAFMQGSYDRAHDQKVQSRVHQVPVDSLKLPFASQTFRMAMAGNVSFTTIVEDTPSVIAEARRVIRDDGMLAFDFPTKEYHVQQGDAHFETRVGEHVAVQDRHIVEHNGRTHSLFTEQVIDPQSGELVSEKNVKINLFGDDEIAEMLLAEQFQVVGIIPGWKQYAPEYGTRAHKTFVFALPQFPDKLRRDQMFHQVQQRGLPMKRYAA